MLIPNTEVFQNTDTEVDIPNIEYLRKNTEKTINWYFHFVITALVMISVYATLAANSPRLNPFHNLSVL